MDMKIEVVPVSVSDVDRAKDFYSKQLGFNVDLDRVLPGGMRIVQLTPPGSGCSIHLVTGGGTPLRGLTLVVPAAVRERTERRLRAVSRAGKLAGWFGEHGR